MILPTSTSTQIPHHKTSKQHSKQAIRQGKLRKYKMFANPVFITPGMQIKTLMKLHTALYWFVVQRSWFFLV